MVRKVTESNFFLVFVLSFAIVCTLSSCCYCKNKSKNKECLFVYVKQEQLRPPGEHHKFQRAVPSRVVFAVENKTDDFIIIRKFDIDRQLPDIDRWYGSAYGSVSHRPLEDIWEYNEMNQCLSEGFFIKGLIAPGAELQVVRNVIFREGKLKLEISYQRLTKDQVAENIYFNVEQGFGFNRTFKRIEDINSLLDDHDLVDWSMAVFPEANKFAMDRMQTLCTVNLREPEFSLKLAEKRLGQKVSDFVFWNDKGAWVLRSKKGVYFVGKDEVFGLGEIDLLAFVLIELGGDSVDFILPLDDYDRFNPQEPKINGPGYFDPGVTAISEERILDFFKFARDRKDAISVLVYDSTGLGKSYYLLAGEFNEKLRRSIAKGE